MNFNRLFLKSIKKKTSHFVLSVEDNELVPTENIYSQDFLYH